MPTSGLGGDLISLRNLAADLADNILAPRAEAVDRDARWPSESMKALADAGLMGLHVPRRQGGLEQGLLALSVVTEELGRACSSTAMCFGMHCVATKVLAAKATPDQEERFLRPIGEGRHISSLALSEPETGIHFFMPRTTFAAAGDSYVLSGVKSFVTSGGHADSYVVSAVPPGGEFDPGAFSCLVLANETAGIAWREEWRGFGMRGNSLLSIIAK
jgi:isovaleryl-CoA dehydrogenase